MRGPCHVVPAGGYRTRAWIGRQYALCYRPAMVRVLVRAGGVALACFAVGCGSSDGEDVSRAGLVILAWPVGSDDASGPLVISGAFSRVNGSSKCAGQAIEGCWFYPCLEASQPAVARDVGTLTISGPGKTLELHAAPLDVSSLTTPETDWAYSGAPSTGWSGGDAITVSVSGSKFFPAMQASLVAPFVTQVEPIELNEKPGGSVQLQVSPSNSATVEVHVGPVSQDLSLAYATCYLSASAGSVEIPARIMSRLSWPAPYQAGGRGGSLGTSLRDGARLSVLGTW